MCYNFNCATAKVVIIFYFSHLFISNESLQQKKGDGLNIRPIFSIYRYFCIPFLSMKNMQENDKIGKLSILVILLFFASCSPEVYRFGTLPVNSVVKGETKEGREFYIVRDADSTELSGTIFNVGDESCATRYRYISDFYGNMMLYSDQDSMRMKIISNEKNDNFHITLPKSNAFHLQKQKIELSYSHLVPSYKELKNRYKEFVFDSISVKEDLLYGRAKGYYTSRPMDSVSNDDYRTMVNTVLKDFSGNVLKKGLSEQNLFLDIYEPYDDHYDKRPVFLFIHGGAFLFGDKNTRLQQALTQELVKRGYVVVSLNYRLGCNFAGFKAVERSIYRGVQDARAALRYLTHYSESFRIDPGQFYLGGSSAGGIIALTTAFMDENEKYSVADERRDPLGALDDSGNILSDPFHIAGTAALWGAVTDLSMIDNDPHIPTLLFHGTADDIVPHQDGLPFKVGMGDFLHSRLSSNWRLYGSEAIYNYMKERDMSVRYVPFLNYGHEPQVGPNGTYNENVDVIKSELQQFLFRNITKDEPQYRIAGDVFVRKTDSLSTYSLPEWSDEKVEWHAVGGFILQQDSQSATIVWFDNVPEHKLIAHIYDEKGREFKREIKVTVYND